MPPPIPRAHLTAGYLALVPPTALWIGTGSASAVVDALGLAIALNMALCSAAMFGLAIVMRDVQTAFEWLLTSRTMAALPFVCAVLTTYFRWSWV
jgi:hypothetical protein